MHEKWYSTSALQCLPHLLLHRQHYYLGMFVNVVSLRFRHVPVAPIPMPPFCFVLHNLREFRPPRISPGADTMRRDS